MGRIEPASVAYGRILLSENSTAARTGVRLSYRETNRRIALVRGAHPGRVPAAPEALGGAGATGGRDWRAIS